MKWSETSQPSMEFFAGKTRPVCLDYENFSKHIQEMVRINSGLHKYKRRRLKILKYAMLCKTNRYYGHELWEMPWFWLGLGLCLFCIHFGRGWPWFLDRSNSDEDISGNRSLFIDVGMKHIVSWAKQVIYNAITENRQFVVGLCIKERKGRGSHYENWAEISCELTLGK